MGLFNLLMMSLLVNYSPKTPVNVNPPRPPKAEQSNYFFGFKGKVNTQDDFSIFYGQKIGNPDDLEINPYFLGGLNKENPWINGKIEFNHEGIKFTPIVNLSSEKFDCQETKVNEEYSNSNSNQRSIKEISIYDQSTKTSEQTTGFGLNETYFFDTGFEVAFTTNSTDDKSTTNLRYEEIYGNNNKIEINNKTTTDLDINNTNKALGLESKLLNTKGVIISAGLYSNWQSMSTKGRIETATQVINNKDTTNSYNVSPIDKSTSRGIYTVKPSFEKETKNVFAYVELPLHFGGHKAAEFNGSISGYLNKWNDKWNRWIGSAILSSNLDEEKAILGINLSHSGRTGKTFKAKKEQDKDYWNNSSSLLCTNKERDIKNEIAYNRFAQNLQGVGGGFKINVKDGERPGYELNVIGSKNNRFGYVSASTQNPSSIENIKNNYEVSATCGFSGNKYNASFNINFSKINGETGYGGGVKVYGK